MKTPPFFLNYLWSCGIYTACTSFLFLHVQQPASGAGIPFCYFLNKQCVPTLKPSELLQCRSGAVYLPYTSDFVPAIELSPRSLHNTIVSKTSSISSQLPFLCLSLLNTQASTQPRGMHFHFPADSSKT